MLLKPGKQTGTHDSPPPALMPSASKSMLKSRCRSPGCKECFFGRTTLTRRPPAAMRPYSRSSTRAFGNVLLMTWRCDLRIFSDSSDESNVDGEPRVKLSASDDKRTSVPWSGRRRSVDGRTEKRCVRVGSVKVDSICIYSASS